MLTGWALTSTRSTKWQLNKATHNRTREDAKHIAPFLFVSEAVRKGKKANNPTNTKSQATKPRNQAKTKSRSQAGEQHERSKREDKRGRKRKTNGQKKRFCRKSHQAPKPPNYSRVQKPHNPRKASRQHKPTRNLQNPVRTPLESEIEPHSQAMHQE